MSERYKYVVDEDDEVVESCRMCGLIVPVLKMSIYGMLDDQTMGRVDRYLCEFCAHMTSETKQQISVVGNLILDAITGRKPLFKGQQMDNPNQIQPINGRILIRRDDPESVTKGGIVLPDTAKEKRVRRGVILALGEGKKRDDGTREPFSVTVGQKVVFTTYAGSDFNHDGKDLLMINEDDILGYIVE